MPKRFNFNSARVWLATIWFAFFGLNCLLILYFFQREWIEWDNTKAALTKISSIYSTYIGSIIGAYVTTKTVKKRAQETEEASPIIAIAVAFIWNIIISFPFLRLLFGSGEIEKSIEQVEWFGSTFNWLVALVMGFYFAQSVSSKEETVK
jgi:ABC-type methionine transport system permease subunit